MRKKVTKRVFIILLAIVGFTTIYLESTSITVGLTECAVIESSISNKLRIKNPGKWYRFPWESVKLYDMSPVPSRHIVEVLDKDKNQISITLVARFSPIRESVDKLHSGLGVEYISSFVEPFLISNIKSKAGDYTSKEMWATHRLEFETTLLKTTREEFSVKSIDLKSLLIISIDLPQNLEELITKELEEAEENDCVFNSNIKDQSIETLLELDSTIEYQWNEEAREVTAVIENDTVYVSIGGCNHYGFTAGLRTNRQNFDDTAYWFNKAKWLANSFLWKSIGEDYSNAIDQGLLTKKEHSTLNTVYYEFPTDRALTNVFLSGVIISRSTNGINIEVGGYMN